MHKTHHSKTDVEGKEGRTGLLETEVTYKAGITNIA
jgi:hypothetical protein